MILIILAISTLAAIFGGAAAYSTSGSLLVALSAYAGTGFLAMVAVLIASMLRENWLADVENDIEATLYPAE